MSALPNIPTVLITNDDGPPGEESPFIETFAAHLTAKLGWRVRVCIPAHQRSWISKAILVNEPVHVTSHKKDWYLATGTPASCVNIALHHLFSDIDLVISGPNLGSNIGNTCALSSGTLGAAMEAALCGTKALALSFAFYNGDIAEPKLGNACTMAVDVVEKLWRKDAWEKAGASVFNVNVPLVEHTACPVFVTRMANGPGFGSLYKPVADVDNRDGVNRITGLPTKNVAVLDDAQAHAAEKDRVFVFSAPYVCDPRPEVGTDTWAIRLCAISVTPLRPELRAIRSIGWTGDLEFQ
ncbi:hypothetical protein EC988_001236 [Linderina pennispora]|nr:hypothetical protein EC988_001236 [Linderina pennispora]